MPVWLRTFLKFAAVSGVGFSCDLVIFSVLQVLLGISTIAANVFSSYAGLTFVYLISVRFVFRKYGGPVSPFLIVYWCYHGISISAYSVAIAWLAGVMQQIDPMMAKEWALLAKLLVTPCILGTNFAFMWALTRFMEDRARPVRADQLSTNAATSEHGTTSTEGGI